MSPLRAFVLLWGLMIFASSLLQAEGGFKYSYIPKKVYENQIFPVTIIDTREVKKKPKYRFDITNDIHPLSEKPLVIRNGNDNFYTFYFKATHAGQITIPRIYVNDGGQITILDQYTIPVEKLEGRPDFCGVLAADMKIRGSQVSHYDEKNYLVSLNIEAFEANLEDMHLSNVVESGVESVRRKGAKAEAEFYAVVPTTQKELSFSYFNTIKQQFITLSVPVELIDNSVVTQTDLNPKEDSFEKLKKYGFMVLVGFFFLMFIIYRDFFYLILGTVSLITLLTFYIPKERVCIKQGAPLYILPTENSGISTKALEQFESPLLAERLDYNKVEYKNGLIGWVKDEDLCKN